MTVGTVTTRVALLQRWLDLSSVARTPTPLGGILSVGQWGCVVPVDFDAEPPTEFDLQAFPIFVSFDQCEGTGITADDFDPDFPDTQQDIADRVQHLVWKAGAGELPPCVIVGLERPDEPISAAVGRADLSGVDLDTVPVVAIALWPLAPGTIYTLRTVLPFRPAPGAIDPAIDDEAVVQPPGVRNIWP